MSAAAKFDAVAPRAAAFQRAVSRRPLYALYVADVVSLSGNAVSMLAIPWFVLTTTGSATTTALVVFFNFLPIVIATLFGGVVVDRLGFRTASVTADLASAGAVAAIPLLHTTVGIELWQLFVLVFVGALLDAPGATARSALLPDMAQLAGVRLERASGIRGAIQQGSQLLGAPVGGLLVAGVGATNALWLNAASFLVSAALVAALVPRVSTPAEEEAPARFLTQLAEGMRFIWSRRLLRAMLVIVLLSNLLEAPFPVIMVVFAEQTYGSAAQLGFLYGTLGGAALVGALVYSWIGHRLPRRRTFVCCFALFPLTYLILATTPKLPVALLTLAVVGLASGPINPLIFTVVAELVPMHLRGRVFGAVRAGAWASIPLGVLAGGALIAAIGVAPTFLALGVSYLFLAAYGFVSPALRDLDGSARDAAVARQESRGGFE